MPPIRILVMLVLAAPAALIGYTVTAQVLSGMDLPGGVGGILIIFLPLFVGGVCAIPFLAPFVDFKAKQALANAPSRKSDDSGSGPGDA